MDMDKDDKRKQDVTQTTAGSSQPAATANQGSADMTATQAASQAATAATAANNINAASGSADKATTPTADAGKPNIIDIGEDADMDIATAIAHARERSKQLREQATNINTDVRPSDIDWRRELDRVRDEYMESDDARAKRERQERTQRKIAALADGFAALSNMGGAMAGATPIKQVSLSAAQQAQADKAKEQRRRDKAAYEMAYRNIMARKADDDKANITDAYRRAKMRDGLLRRADDIDGDILRAIADKTKHEGNLRERSRHNRASEDIAHKRASKSGSSAGKGSNKYYGTLNGLVYQTKADYDKAVQQGAKTANVPTATEDAIGNRKDRKTSAIAADVEAARKSERLKNKLIKITKKQ